MTAQVSHAHIEQTRNVAELTSLTNDQERAIHLAACRIVAEAVRGRKAVLSDATLAGTASQQLMGAFVTLKRKGHLRACCGSLGVPTPLGTALAEAAVRTATADTRFPTISPTELPFTDVDVTLLFNFQNVLSSGIARRNGIEIGRHGLRIQRGNQAGLLLPSVAVEHKMDADGFLMALCRKAGLPPTAWADEGTQLTTFEGHAIHGPFEIDSDMAVFSELPPSCSAGELSRLAEHCRSNIIALLNGEAPNYFAVECPDGTAHGLILSVSAPWLAEPLVRSKFSTRQKHAMQSTLFELSQNVAKTLGVHRVGQPGGPGASSDLRVSISLLQDPAMHGSVANVDLGGIDVTRRGLLVMEDDRHAFVFSAKLTPEILFQSVVMESRVARPEVAGVLSFAVTSTEDAARFSNVPRTGNASARPPAVAGRFYPDEYGLLTMLVGDLLETARPEGVINRSTTTSFLASLDPRHSNPSAIMVPHAGFVFSGKVAASAFQQVTLTETVIVIGPKHTRVGVDWAVAPNASWSLPCGEVATDLELSRRIVEAIPGLKFDAAAHAQEHSIEVELPFVKRVAPKTKVVGIVLGAGDLSQLTALSTGLVSVLKELPGPPLFIISTDMNHFAMDAENRRLDEMALACLDRLDTGSLWKTCRDNNISMCGIRPAIVVLEALRQLGRLNWSERIGYATSFDQSGDPSRVVGYASMAFGG